MINEKCNLQLSNESFDRNQFNVDVFVDLSKAFDNHQISINKLKYFFNNRNLFRIVQKLLK